MEINIEQIQEELKQTLSEKRYVHSIGVMKRSEELAKIYGLDVMQAKIVGLTHDIAKEMTKEQSIQYAKEHNIELDEIEKAQPSLLHGKIGAHICKEKYGFTEQMQKAIIYHTTGDEKMDTLAKVIFVADKTEAHRSFDDLAYIIKLSNQDLDAGIIYIIDKALRKTMEKGQLIHPKSISTRNALIMQKK